MAAVLEAVPTLSVVKTLVNSQDEREQRRGEFYRGLGPVRSLNDGRRGVIFYRGDEAPILYGTFLVAPTGFDSESRELPENASFMDKFKKEIRKRLGDPNRKWMNKNQN